MLHTHACLWILLEHPFRKLREDNRMLRPSRQRQAYFERPPNRQPHLLRPLRAQTGTAAVVVVALLLAIVETLNKSLAMYRENSNACMEKV